MVELLINLDICLLRQLNAPATKLCGPVSNVEEVDKIREDLVKLSSWSSEWLMLFNKGKSEVLHIGKNNTKINYEMRGKIVYSWMRNGT